MAMTGNLKLPAGDTGDKLLNMASLLSDKTELQSRVKTLQDAEARNTAAAKEAADQVKASRAEREALELQQIKLDADLGELEGLKAELATAREEMATVTAARGTLNADRQAFDLERREKRDAIAKTLEEAERAVEEARKAESVAKATTESYQAKIAQLREIVK